MENTTHEGAPTPVSGIFGTTIMENTTHEGTPTLASGVFQSKIPLTRVPPPDYYGKHHSRGYPHPREWYLSGKTIMENTTHEGTHTLVSRVPLIKNTTHEGIPTLVSGIFLVKLSWKTQLTRVPAPS